MNHLAKKDFALRIKICRKEAKESRYLAAINRSDRREFGEQTRLARARGARIDEHFWRSCARASNGF
jgi:hypothetical protein